MKEIILNNNEDLSLIENLLSQIYNHTYRSNLSLPLEQDTITQTHYIKHPSHDLHLLAQDFPIPYSLGHAKRYRRFEIHGIKTFCKIPNDLASTPLFSPAKIKSEILCRDQASADLMLHSKMWSLGHRFGVKAL